MATPEDPASARLGESFWAFLPRTMIGSLASAWALEKERLKRAGHGVWNWRNENLQAWAMTVVFFGALNCLGLGIIDAVVVQEEMGRAVFPGPYFSSALAATLAARALGLDEQLEALAAGMRRGTVAIDEAGHGDPL